jgi:alkaline phosphatase D
LPPICHSERIDLIVTDQRTHHSEEPTDMPEAKGLASDDFPDKLPEEPMKILDAARAYNVGKPPATIRSTNGAVEIPNIWKDRPPQTILDAEQKAWFLERLKNSKANWKIWGNTTATLDMRANPQNFPEGLGELCKFRRWRRPQHRLH